MCVCVRVLLRNCFIHVTVLHIFGHIFPTIMLLTMLSIANCECYSSAPFAHCLYISLHFDFRHEALLFLKCCYRKCRKIVQLSRVNNFNFCVYILLFDLICKHEIEGRERGSNEPHDREADNTVRDRERGGGRDLYKCNIIYFGVLYECAPLKLYCSSRLMAKISVEIMALQYSFLYTSSMGCIFLALSFVFIQSVYPTSPSAHISVIYVDGSEQLNIKVELYCFLGNCNCFLYLSFVSLTLVNRLT